MAECRYGETTSNEGAVMISAEDFQACKNYDNGRRGQYAAHGQIVFQLRNVRAHPIKLGAQIVGIGHGLNVGRQPQVDNIGRNGRTPVGEFA